MEANVLIERNAQKKGFKSRPIAINSESEDGQVIGHRSQMAGNPSLLVHFSFLSVYAPTLRFFFPSPPAYPIGW